MKRIVVIIAFCATLIGVKSFAQEVVAVKKKTYISRNFSQLRYNYRNRNYDRFHGHLSGIALGYSGLVSSLGNLSLPAEAAYMSQKGNSIVFDINFCDFNIHLSRNMGFVVGLGIEANNFKFDNSVSLKQNENGYIVADDYGARGTALEKSKLSTNYLTIPLLFEVQFGKRADFFVNFGLIGAWRMQSHTKVKGSGGEVNGIEKNKKGLNMTNLRYGYMVQVGFDNFGIYTKYYPESIFKKDKGPKVSQMNVGLICYFRNFY